MVLYLFGRGPGITTEKRAAHLVMVVYRVIVAEGTGMVEVQWSTTKGHPGISLQGALDVAFPGARRNEERNGRSTRVEKPRRLRNGLYPRRTLIEVRTFY
jgi:hypothetical protein